MFGCRAQWRWALQRVDSVIRFAKQGVTTVGHVAIGFKAPGKLRRHNGPHRQRIWAATTGADTSRTEGKSQRLQRNAWAEHATNGRQTANRRNRSRMVALERGWTRRNANRYASGRIPNPRQIGVCVKRPALPAWTGRV